MAVNIGEGIAVGEGRVGGTVLATGGEVAFGIAGAVVGVDGCTEEDDSKVGKMTGVDVAAMFGAIWGREVAI